MLIKDDQIYSFMDSINIQTSNTNKVLYSIKEFAIFPVYNNANHIELTLSKTLKCERYQTILYLKLIKRCLKSDYSIAVPKAGSKQKSRH